MSFNRRTKGTQGEDIAVEYLQNKGLTILERNFRFERGEIDIVAEEHGALIFIEVKTRRSRSFGEPEEAVTPAKRKQIRRVAEGYLFTKEIFDKECRFDVVTILYHGQSYRISHFVNAF